MSTKTKSRSAKTATRKTRKTAAKKKAPAKKPTRKASAAAPKTSAARTAKRTPAVAKKKTAAPAGKTRAASKRTAPARKSSTAGRAKTAATKTPPRTTARRAVFVDVENTSSAASLLEVIDSLQIDRTSRTVELFAVGNWRVVGQHVGRELAALGAHLVHSAPARGVRDWSDLWIAVAAGGWIARANPGDVLEIVSNDRAFDAVGDAAAAEGVIYRRIQHRRSSAAAAASEAAEPEAGEHRPRSRRRRRPRRSRAEGAVTAASAAPAVAAPADDEEVHEVHGASRDQIIAVVQELAQGRSTPWVNLDVLEAALKRLGFQRPANSPRLVTRLRRLKDFEVDSHGRVRIAEGSPAA